MLVQTSLCPDEFMGGTQHPENRPSRLALPPRVPRQLTAELEPGLGVPHPPPSCYNLNKSILLVNSNFSDMKMNYGPRLYSF